jgi:hypothetical protein
LSAGGVTVGGTVQSVLADLVTTLSKIVPAGATNIEFDVAVDVSAVKAAGIEASRDCTVKTNSTSAPDDTLSLVAGVPLIWVTGDAATFFLTADVTKFYITTPAGTDTTFKFTAAIDSTPVLS